MKRPKRRTRPARPPAPRPPGARFEKPFFFLVCGAVVASVVCAGCAFHLIRPYRPLALGTGLFLVATAALSGRLACRCGRAVAARVRRWRGPVSDGP